MPFFGHIAELRRRLMVIAAVVFIGSVATYAFAWSAFDLLMAPLEPLMEGAKWTALGPFEWFTLRFKVSFYLAVIIGSPIIIWQVMAFFLPALKPKERRYVIPTFVAMLVLFLAGNAFCYELVLTPAFSWMVTQGPGVSQNIWQAAMWFNAVTLLMLGFGIGFQLPVIVFYLLLFNIVPYAKLRQNWRVSYVVLIITASIATPDWSPVTMGLLFGALVALYEASMLFARVALARRIAEQKRAELED